MNASNLQSRVTGGIGLFPVGSKAYVRAAIYRNLPIGTVVKVDGHDGNQIRVKKADGVSLSIYYFAPIYLEPYALQVGDEVRVAIDFLEPYGVKKDEIRLVDEIRGDPTSENVHILSNGKGALRFQSLRSQVEFVSRAVKGIEPGSYVASNSGDMAVSLSKGQVAFGIPRGAMVKASDVIPAPIPPLPIEYWRQKDKETRKRAYDAEQACEQLATELHTSRATVATIAASAMVLREECKARDVVIAQQAAKLQECEAVGVERGQEIDALKAELQAERDSSKSIIERQDADNRALAEDTRLARQDVDSLRYKLRQCADELSTYKHAVKQANDNMSAAQGQITWLAELYDEARAEAKGYAIESEKRRFSWVDFGKGVAWIAFAVSMVAIVVGH